MKLQISKYKIVMFGTKILELLPICEWYIFT